MRSKTITVDHRVVSRSIQHMRDVEEISPVYIRDWEQYYHCQYVRFNRRKNTSVIKFSSEHNATEFVLRFA